MVNKFGSKCVKHCRLSRKCRETRLQ